MKRIMLLVYISVLFIVGCAPTIKVMPTATNITVYSSPSPTAIKEMSTPIPMLTVTPVPTLLEDDARAKLFELLVSNNNCQLPCLWGIKPGKTTIHEAKDILAPLAGISEATDFNQNGGAINLVYIEDDTSLGVAVRFTLDPTLSDQVTRVSFQGSELKKISDAQYGEFNVPVYDSEAFREHLKPYMLSQILSEHGVPSGVAISTDGGQDRGKNVPGFYVLLFYPDQGLLVSYTTNRQLSGDNVLGCLSSAWVDLELFPLGKSDSFSEFLSQTKWVNLWPIPDESQYWKPIEMATSMSLNQFYETFRKPTDVCIKTPLNLWPIPER